MRGDFVSKINVEGSEISIIAIDNRDYISLTDMVRNIENGSALIEKWLRNKNTIEFFLSFRILSTSHS